MNITSLFGRLRLPVLVVAFAFGCDELTVDDVQTEVPDFDIGITCRGEVFDSTLAEGGFCQMTVGDVDTLEMTFLIDSVSVTGIRVRWTPLDSGVLSIRTMDQVIDSTTRAGLTSSEALALTRKAEVVALRRGIHEVRFEIDSAGFLVNAEQRDTFNLFLEEAAFFQIRTNERWARVATGRDHSCALTYDDRDTLYAAFSTRLRPGGQAFCWGFNTDGALGTGDFDADVPQQVAADDRFTSIDAGADHTCAVDFRRLVSCWGGNERGQLGTGDELDQFTPRRLALGSPFQVASTGDEFTCGAPATAGFALSSICWGSNVHGQLGCDTGIVGNPCLDVSIDEKGDQLVPSEDVKTDPTIAGDPSNGDISFSTVTAGARHACGLVIDVGPMFAGTMADRTAWCWGDNRFGQLGISSALSCDAGAGAFACERLAVQAQGPGGGTPVRFVEIAAGGEFTCGVVETGADVYCWGRNNAGQLGNGTTVDSDAPVQVMGNFGTGVLALTAGDTHACVVTLDSVAYCWGANADGQLGDSTTVQRPQPVAVVGGHAFTSVAAGSNHTCAVVSTAGFGFAPADQDGGGPIYCWGSNGSQFSGEFGGKLGTGSRDDTNMVVSSVFPVRVAEPFDLFFF